MEKIIILNKINGFYSDVLKKKFKINFEVINYYLNENLNKSEKIILKEINELIEKNNINYLVAEGDYLSLINFNFIQKINCNKKILFLTDDYDMHEINFITAKAFDFIFTACPISNYRYLEKGYDSYFVPLEANKFLFKKIDLKKKYDVSFFGAKKSTREEYIKYLNENKIDVNLMGFYNVPDYNWDNLSKFISQSKIVLNFSNTGNKNKFYSHSTIKHNFFSFKGRPIMVGLCGTLCVSEFSPANQILFNNDLPTFKNKEELLNECKKILNDDNYYDKLKNSFVEKCNEYEDHIYFKKVLEKIANTKNSKKNLNIKLPYWYIRIFLNQKIRNISKRKNLIVYFKELSEIIFLKISKNKFFHIPLIVENLIKFPFIIIKVIINKFKR